jgi:hypothetical protein
MPDKNDPTYRAHYVAALSRYERAAREVAAAGARLQKARSAGTTPSGTAEVDRAQRDLDAALSDLAARERELQAFK